MPPSPENEIDFHFFRSTAMFRAGQYNDCRENMMRFICLGSIFYHLYIYMYVCVCVFVYHCESL